MRDRNHRGCEQKDIFKHEKQKRRDQANCDQNKLNERRLRFRGEEFGATLEKIRQRARERDQTADETGLARSTSRRRIFASHSAKSRSAPKDQPKNKSHAERGKDCLGWILADVLFGIVLKRPRARARIAQCL